MKKENNVNIHVYIKTEDEKHIEVRMNFIFLPRIGEVLQYNGVAYRIYDIRHHYKESFAPYIEIFCSESIKIL